MWPAFRTVLGAASASLYLDAKPSHVGTDMDGLACIIQNPLTGDVPSITLQGATRLENVKDRRRRPDRGEWEPIKISRGNLSYVLNLA
jgi:hypothetical protein